ALDELERSAGVGQRLLAAPEPPAGAGQALEQHGRAPRLLALVHQLERGAQQRLGARVVARLQVRFRGAEEQLAAVAAAQHLGVERLADGERAQQLLRRLAEALDAHHQRVAERRREPAATVEAGGQELLHEQRVALAARVEPAEEVAGRRRAEDVLERRAQL